MGLFDNPSNGFFASPSLTKDTASSSSTRDPYEEEDDLTFETSQEEADYYRDKYRQAVDLLNETRAELDDFQASSRELEQELERELEQTDARQSELRDRIQILEKEREEWRSKYVNLQKQSAATTSAMQREMDNLRSERDKTLVALRDLELGNDELERNERVAVSSLLDMEIKYNRAIEEKTLLEQEIVQKQEVEEETQRLRDELRDANNEITILRDQIARSVVPTPPASDAAPMSPMPSRSDSRASRPVSPLTECSETPASVQSDAQPHSDRSGAVSSRTTRPIVPAGSARVPRTATGMVASPSKRNVSLPASSAIPAMTRSTTMRNMAGNINPHATAATRPARQSYAPTSYAPSPGRAESHQAAKTKGFKLLQDLQARLKATDDRIGNKMGKKSLPATVLPGSKRATKASTASSTVSSATTVQSVNTMTAASVTPGKPRPAATEQTPAVTPGGGAPAGVFSPSSWVILDSDTQDTPTASGGPTTAAQLLSRRDEPVSPLDRARSLASSRGSSRGLPSRPAIPSPLTQSTSRSPARLARSTNIRPSLAASTSASSRPPRSSAAVRTPLSVSTGPSSAAASRPSSRTGQHARTSSRSGAMSPTFIPGPRRGSFGIGAAADAISGSSSASHSATASISSRVSSRLAEEPATGSTARVVSRSKDLQSSLGRGQPPAASSTAAGPVLPGGRRATTPRRSSIAVPNLGSPDHIRPHSAGAVLVPKVRPTSFPAFSGTPPPPVPRIPSSILRDREAARAQAKLSAVERAKLHK